MGEVAWANTVSIKATMSDEVVCYICMRPGADSSDHLIPLAFFPTPRPSNLVTLAAHRACHSNLSEDYVRAILAGLSRNPTAERVKEQRVRPSLLKSDLKDTKLRRDLIRTLKHPNVEIRSPAGLVLGTAAAIEFDARRVYPLLEKIVRGVHYHATSRLLEPNSRFVWKLNESPRGAVAAAWARVTPGLSYEGVFESKYWAPDDGGREMSVWWFRFYESMVFQCLATHPTELLP